METIVPDPRPTIGNPKEYVQSDMKTIVPDSMLIGNPREYVQSYTTAQTALPKNNFQQSAHGNIDMITRPSKCQNPRPPRPPPLNLEYSGSSVRNVRRTFQSESSSSNVPNPRSTFPESSAPSVPNYRATTVQPSYQSPPESKNSGPVFNNVALPNITRINDLNCQETRWTIKATVISKEAVRLYYNSKGSGRYFSFILGDMDGKIRVVCFNDVVDQFYAMIEVGNVYLISKAKICRGLTTNALTTSEFEIILTRSSRVEPCADDGLIPDSVSNPREYVQSDTTAQTALPKNNFQQSAYGNIGMIGQGPVSKGQRPRLPFNPEKSASSMPNVRPESSSYNVSNPRSTFPESSAPSVPMQPPYQPPPQSKNSGPVFTNEALSNITPINDLNFDPNCGETRWAIKARVISKWKPYECNKARDSMKYFFFILRDKDAEIRVVCFSAVFDRFYEMIEVGKVYLISKAKIQSVRTPNSKFELTLDESSRVEPCADDGSIPGHRFYFKTMKAIESATANSILDAIGIVTTVDPPVPVRTKLGGTNQRRDLCMKDSSGKTIKITLWRKLCEEEGQWLHEMFASAVFPVLAVVGGKVNGSGRTRSIETINSTQLHIDPDFPEAHELRHRFVHGENDAHSVKRSPFC